MKLYINEIVDDLGYAVVAYSSKEKAKNHAYANCNTVETYIGEIEMVIQDFYEGIEIAVKV